MPNRCPNLFIVTAPSGSGKTTIVKHILEKYPLFSFSTSATNRSPRSGEVHGKDYYFLSEKEFMIRIENEEFVEWEEVYPGRYYGTLKSEVDRIKEEGKIVTFDIEVNGAHNIKNLYNEDALSLFVAPPSFEELARRLHARATESREEIRRRLDRARAEMREMNNFDHILINDDLEYALKLAERIVEDHLSCNWN